MIEQLGYIAYVLGVKSYALLVWLVAPFNSKASSFIKGRRGLLQKIEHATSKDSRPKIWFHCASLGEFEQARPVMEQLRNQHPQTAIVVTFFSPSGYEIRKNYAGADYIFYLPLDSPSHAARFVKAVQPSLVFFVKYEIWYFYLKALTNQNIPVVLISANFRTNHIYFKWYGLFFKNMLFHFNHIFCQNEASAQLLNQQGIKHTSVSRDTRFDRVAAHSKQALQIAPAASFKQNYKILIAGSSYAQEEALIAAAMHPFKDWKIIIAPHHIAHQRIVSIQQQFAEYGVTTFTELSADAGLATKRVLIIDNIGMLSSLYQYADVAFVGGGFGKTGLHNILEAAVFGVPVVFGPNNLKKFPESLDLIEAGAGFVVTDPEQLQTLLQTWSLDPKQLERTAKLAQAFINSQTGATEHILSYLRLHKLIASE